MFNELVFVITAIGCGAAAAIVTIAFAFSYKIVVETRIKSRILDRETQEEAKLAGAAEGLERRMDALGEKRFGVPMIPRRELPALPPTPSARYRPPAAPLTSYSASALSEKERIARINAPKKG